LHLIGLERPRRLDVTHPAQRLDHARRKDAVRPEFVVRHLLPADLALLATAYHSCN
jgi:hypothetical protein